MSISESTVTFFNRTVTEYDGEEPVELSDHIVYRLSLDYDDERTMTELIEEFLGRVDKSQLDALIIGKWSDDCDESSESIVNLLVAHAAELPAMRALFIGDMTYEECEISWIMQSDVTPLLNAFPLLEEFRVRGSNHLEIQPFTHAHLRKLVIESGGLPSELVEALTASTIPALTHLELWLGTDEYGFSGSVDLYQRLVAKLRTPTLEYLGLRDASIADELAEWLAQDEVVACLDTLDLSLGILGDVGAEALFNSPYVPKLQTLDLEHHYISEAWQEKLKTLPITVDLSDPQEIDDEDDSRYVAVSE
ncbi:STM4015 family protein [Massilia sp. DJPM01]|uniref:STM4015 family protein n=1 Tax=Massilia sp. DJPM01 TaxID=3024404 RepID=UPI00259E5337|nr:STM4015 family protein [Massilia sp. DJPM01]MDM5177532.1 STM4015 family protein [Massilia sp. DJPM01]